MQKLIVTINSKYTDLTKTLKAHPVLGELYENMGKSSNLPLPGHQGRLLN